MKQLFIIIVFGGVLLSVSCGPGKQRENPPYSIEPPSVKVPPDTLHTKSQELDTGKPKPPSKTVEWFNVSTLECTTYLNKTVEVDKILRKDANNLYGVEIRLKNLTSQDLHCEFKINFYSEKEEQLLSDKEGWTPFFLKPFGFEYIYDHSRLQGAVGFILFVRSYGTTSTGVQDEIFETKEGELYLDKAVIVEKVVKRDTDESHEVRFYLKSLSKEPLIFEYKIEFYTNLNELINRKGVTWKRVKINPLDTISITDSIKQKTALGFKLFIQEVEK